MQPFFQASFRGAILKVLFIMAIQNSAFAASNIDLMPGDVIRNAPASYYGPGFHGKRTSSGEAFDRHAYTLAVPAEQRHVYCMGTEVLVQNSAGKKVKARITDTGPFSKYGKKFDLSEGLFAQMAPLSKGVTTVTVTILRKGHDCRPIRRRT